MNKRIWLLTVVVVIAVAAVMAFIALRNTEKTKDYKIGVVLSLTGRGATYGQRALKGMQLAVSEVNEQEQFRNRPVRLVVEDSRSDARQAVSAFTKLVDTADVQAVIGLVLSDEVLACAPIANRRKVILLTTAAGSDKIKEAGDYIFRNRESAAAQADAIAKCAIDNLGYKKIAVLHSNSANGLSYANDFTRAVRARGGNVDTSIAYNEGKTDYRAEIERLRATNPRAVYLAGLDQELGLILKQCRELGFSPQFFASTGAISARLLGIAGAGAEGLVCGSAPFDAGSSDPKIRAFASSFKARFAEEPDFIAANSYDAVRLLTSFFVDGKLSGNQIRSALYRTKKYPGVGGNTTFDSRGEVQKPVFVVQVKKGKFVSMEAKPNGGR